MKISFYYVDEKYVEYLKNKEITYRNYTTVPNVKYANSNKFFYGIVMEINSIPFYVPITHNTKEKEHNIVIYIEHNHKKEAVGSLRFNYMIPVPKSCITPLDFNDSKMYSEETKIKLQKEYKFCKSNLARIQKLAKKTYEQVELGKNRELVNNSCAFNILKEAYKEFLEMDDTY